MGGGNKLAANSDWARGGGPSHNCLIERRSSPKEHASDEVFGNAVSHGWCIEQRQLLGKKSVLALEIFYFAINEG